MAELRIIPGKQIDKDLIFYIRNQMQEKLPDGLFDEVTAHADRLDVPEDAFTPTRDRYRAEQIMPELVSNMPEKGRAIGIIDEDILTARQDFVFGLAEKGRNSLVSLTRLREQFYGREPDTRLFKERALKLTMHEFGHSMGLEKCNNECIMSGISTIEKIDSLDTRFCNECKEKLRETYLRQIGESR
jgi:archaemetzincin